LTDKRKVRIIRRRDVHTYCELWSAAYSLLLQGRSEEEGSYYQFMGSLVFTAFSLEAFLNHIGPKLFMSWSDHERLGPREKLDLVACRVGVKVNYGQRPWQIMKKLFEFRNDVAHGKSVKVLKKDTIPLKRYQPGPVDLARTRWEEFCTHKNAERAREDVERMVHALNEASGLREHPFIGGWQENESTLEEG
jgi:hypothetical protein